jgi:hypothetical protein
MRRVVIRILMILFFLQTIGGSFQCLPSDYDSYEEYLSVNFRTFINALSRGGEGLD